MIRNETFAILFLSAFLISNFSTGPPEQPWQGLFSGIPHQRGMISKIYDFILALIKNAWEIELGIQLSDKVWEHVRFGLPLLVHVLDLSN